MTVYVPGLRSTIRYWPVLPVTTDRTRSINAGLVASTVTPGSTAPDVSRAIPVMVACAHAAVGRSINTQLSQIACSRRILSSHSVFYRPVMRHENP
ncbi:hypothetical protein D3C83_54000 [compost metagenome]